MAWTKTLVVTAKAGNEDIQIRFAFRDQLLMFDVWVDSVAEPQEFYTDELNNSSLTSQQRTDLIAALKVLRDDALTALGFNQT